MLPKAEVEKLDLDIWQRHYDWCIADTMADPTLTADEKQELLRQLALPDDKWQPIELPVGAEPVSVTLIKMRRGEI